MICGSGLGVLADSLDEKVVLDYDQIPYFAKSGEIYYNQGASGSCSIKFSYPKPVSA